MQTLASRFVRLALPNVASNLLVPVAGLVDVAMLGHFGGVHDLAGVALASVLFDYLFWTFGFLRMGTTGLAAQAAGRGDAQATADILTRGLAIGAGVGLVIAALGAPLSLLGFGILEGTEAVKTAGRAYFDARIWGAPFALCSFVMQGYLLANERGRAVLLLSAVGNLSNIALDYVLIARMGWGPAGAGYATLFSQVAMFSVGCALLSMHARERGWRIRRAALRDAGELRKFLALGGDILIRTFALLTAFAVFIDFSAALGTERLASNAMVLRVVTFSAYFVDGYAFSLESLAGQLKGGQNTLGVCQPLRRLLLLGCRWGLMTAALFALAAQVFAPSIFGLLTRHQALVDLATADAPWLWPLLLIGSLAYLLDGYFLGLAEGRILSRMMLLSLGVGFFPLALWGRLSASPTLLWAAMVGFMLARTVSLAAHVPGSWAQAPSQSSS